MDEEEFGSASVVEEMIEEHMILNAYSLLYLKQLRWLDFVMRI